jgi:hypothetical protein
MPPSLSAEEAAHRIGEAVVVEMVVQRTKSCSGSCQVFLDSEASHRDPKNLGVVLSKDARGRFAEAGIEDPCAYFKGKTIRVHGVVIQKDKGPAIEIEEPSQIAVLDASSPGQRECRG